LVVAPGAPVRGDELGAGRPVGGGFGACHGGRARLPPVPVPGDRPAEGHMVGQVCGRAARERATAPAAITTRTKAAIAVTNAAAASSVDRRWRALAADSRSSRLSPITSVTPALKASPAAGSPMLTEVIASSASTRP